ncbi:Hypothetical protein PHPALM_17800 [Phytophthora palmivora]|uniref:Uncharacterized protein n=1 Tax=Phytophthora palmivora TaxID=4796 RepID=A0A2P4XLI0_9STRA|nr:Hypothetical protein PHPALM_17800 [Phytophthora palmivora]
MAKSCHNNKNKGLRNGNRGNHGRSHWRNKYHGHRNRDEGDNSDYGVVAITTLDLSKTPKR